MDIEYPSKVMRDVMDLARQVSRTDSIVLFQGESGSGKDYLAQWLHNHSPRSDGPYFSINCAALPGELFESELFGHEKGAFTGAEAPKKGIVELAEKGTLFLNEIGELDLSKQAKLLAFLDTNRFMRVGGETQITADVRIMAATHRTLAEEVKSGRFLSPLFYRLAVFIIEIPPLRKRVEDIPVLVEEILSTLAPRMGLSDIPEIDSVAMGKLSTYHWPGNVRELKNVLERALILCDGDTLKPEHVRFEGRQGEMTAEKDSMPLIIQELPIRFKGKQVRGLSLEDRQRINQECIVDRGWTQARVAHALGVDPSSVSKWLKGL